jgi:NAD(P)-dependent dehydrogenase (short-subunit alcohol dehydrogenase family)
MAAGPTSKGIGLAVVRTLLEEGARVVATSRSPSAGLDRLEGDLHHVRADFMDPLAPAEVMSHAVEKYGGLDVLVNNAGGPPPGTKLPQAGFLDLTDDGWARCSSSTSSRPSEPAGRRSLCSSNVVGERS